MVPIKVSGLGVSKICWYAQSVLVAFAGTKQTRFSSWKERKMRERGKKKDIFSTQ